MCGIVGKLYFDTNKIIDSSEIKRMADTIVHRGPDDEGYYIDKFVGLGFRRLSIIDLQTGHQPLSNVEGSIWIVFNGEIYNYKILKDSLIKKGYQFKTNTDTEVIVNLYEEYGSDSIKYLRGMFSFVIWDKRKKLLFGARDRFGIKPFYYYYDDKQFVWGSEIKAVNAAEGIKKQVDYCALDSYLTYGYILNDRSIYTTIKKLLPSHYFILKPFENNIITIKKYWDVFFEPDYTKTEDHWKELISETLLDSVKIRLVSDVPLGAFLSGGIDSSSIVALMSQVSDKPVKTFSIGFKEAKFNELQYARQIAERYSTDHHEMMIEPESIKLLPMLVQAYDEPFADSSAIPTYYVSKFAREYVTVILSGDGGDELFSGYNSYPKMEALKNNPLNTNFTTSIFKAINHIIPDYLFGKGYTYRLSKDKNSIGAYFCLWNTYERSKLYCNNVLIALQEFQAEDEKLMMLRNIKGDFLSRMQGLDMKTYLVDDILTKVDRVSMINSLEIRVPILDHKFAELSYKIPSNLKLNGNDKKYIFKKALSKYLPRDIINHRKHGFSIPLKYWFRNDLKEYINDDLTSSSSKISEYFNRNAIISTIKNHEKGMRDYSSKIWSLLFLNEWLRQNN